MLQVKLFITLIFLYLSGALCAAPEQGKFKTILNKGSEAMFIKTLYRYSTLKITVVRKEECKPDNEPLYLKWVMRSSTCFMEYAGLTNNTSYIDRPEVKRIPGGHGAYIRNGNNGEEIDCADHAVSLTDFSNSTLHPWTIYPEEVKTVTTQASTESDTSDSKSGNRRKRAEDSPPPSSEITNSPVLPANNPIPDTTNTAVKTPVQHNSAVVLSESHVVAMVPSIAPYIVAIRIEGKAEFSYEVSVEMKTPLGYLSAHDYPLLTFYMIMCIVYVLYAVAWLVMSACNFRDLLRVQFWIGGVILLGMIEKAVFYSEYLSVNTTGESVPGAAKFAEVVSALKRALARMLVIIVSLGFGIVKPRLGPMLHRVIGVGMLYFILAVVEALVRSGGRDASHNQLFAAIPLAVLDSVICWWIFMSLMQTMKTLRLRRNVVKLSLYRHFSNTIIFCVLASFIMIFWSNNHDQCFTEWSEAWVEDAFWHILFSVILMVIMVLWRPNINNQRYAFSPLIDGGDEDDLAEPMLGAGTTESIKMRGTRSDATNFNANKTEDDLKWIEENIPQTVADAALPAIMDSDEEVMTTKYEMSKME